MCRDERVQISLRTAQFSYVVVASTSRELNLAILPIPLTSKDRSFCRGGFNKPCTWNDPLLRSFFIHSSSAYSLEVWSVKTHNIVDFVFFENHFWNAYNVFDMQYVLNIFWKFSFSISFWILQLHIDSRIFYTWLQRKVSRNFIWNMAETVEL